MRIVVVGAGLGGLAAAIAAVRAGHEVVVCERAPRLRETGTGIELMPNGVLALDSLGVGEQVRSMAVTWPERGGSARSPRPVVAVHPPGGAGAAGRPPVVIAARQWLHRLLADALPSGVVRTGVSVRAVHDHGETVLSSTDDGELAADLVIAADGVGSTIRSQLSLTTPALSAAVSWPRGRWSSGRCRSRSCRLASCSTIAAASGSAALAMVDGQVYWYASWRAERPDGPREWLIDRFADWHPAVPALIAAADPDGVHVDETVRLARPPPSFVAGRVLLLGDAAHAMTPDLGQGGCQAFEDAVALGRELTGARTAGLADALRRYDARRRPRTSALLRASTRMNRVLTLTGPAGRLRNLALRSVPGGLATRMLIRQLCMSGRGLTRMASSEAQPEAH